MIHVPPQLVELAAGVFVVIVLAQLAGGRSLDALSSPRVTAPLVAYRVWNVQGGRLESVTNVGWYGVWNGSVAEAYCFSSSLGPPHEAPAKRCRCGIYAVDSLRTALSLFPNTLRSGVGPRDSGSVVGAVQLWGAPARPVVVGEVSDRWGLQYRAPFARVIALAADEQGLSARVGETLGVPVVPPQTLEWYAREYGEQLHPRVQRTNGQWAAFGMKVAAMALARLAWRLARWAAPRVWTLIRPWLWPVREGDR